MVLREICRFLTPRRRDVSTALPALEMDHNTAAQEHSKLEGNARQATQSRKSLHPELGRIVEEAAADGGAARGELGAHNLDLAPIATTSALLARPPSPAGQDAFGCGNFPVAHVGHPNVKKAEQQSLCRSTVHQRDIPRYLSISLSMLARVGDAEVQDVVAHIMKAVADLGAQTALSWKSEPGRLGGVEIAVQLGLVEQTPIADDQVWEVFVCLRVQEEAQILCAVSQSRAPRKKTITDQGPCSLPQFAVVQHQPTRNLSQASMLAKQKHETPSHSVDLSAPPQRLVELFF